jgi:hypothetical protein
MALENVHPVVLERIKNQLPDGFTVLSAVAESESKTAFLVEQNGITQKAYMLKGNLLQVMAHKAPEVSAKEGDLLGAVVQELSDAYQLHLLDKVDYNVDDLLVEFVGKDQVQVSVSILPTSTSLSGVLIFTVRNKDAAARPLKQSTLDLEEHRVRLALAGKVFEVTDPEPVNPDKTLTQEFAEQLEEFVGSLGFTTPPTADDFQLADVLSQLHDGISALVIIKLPSDLVVPVRWK